MPSTHTTHSPMTLDGFLATPVERLSLGTYSIPHESPCAAIHLQPVLSIGYFVFALRLSASIFPECWSSVVLPWPRYAMDTWSLRFPDDPIPYAFQGFLSHISAYRHTDLTKGYDISLHIYCYEGISLALAAKLPPGLEIA